MHLKIELFPLSMQCRGEEKFFAIYMPVTCYLLLLSFFFTKKNMYLAVLQILNNELPLSIYLNYSLPAVF